MSKSLIKILIAEDNSMNRFFISTIVTSLFPHIEIIESANGHDAVAKFIEFQPDFIFMDVQMPLVNGLEATERIRALDAGSKVPIIALTGGTESEVRDLCLSSGMNDFITKPIIKEIIKDVIIKYIPSLSDKELYKK